MKSKFDAFINAIIILIFWGLCIFKIYIDYDNGYLLDTLFHSFLIALSTIASIFCIFIDYKISKPKKKIYRLPSTIATIASAIALTMVTQFLKNKDESPIVLYASNFYSGLNSISIKFRKNGTYKCEKANFLSENYFIKGQYSIKDSIIYLDKSNLFGLINSDKLLLKSTIKIKKPQSQKQSETLFNSSNHDTISKTFIYQLTKLDKIDSSQLTLTVDNEFLELRKP